MGSRLVSRGWVLAALFGVVALLLGSARPWLHARSEDAVVGGATLTITGSDLSRAVPAAALLGGAALLAGLVGSTVVRRFAGVCLLLAAVVAGAPVVGALRDPAAAAVPALEERTAITGAGDTTLQAQADPTWVLYLALAAVLALAVAGVLRLLPAPQRQGPQRQGPQRQGPRRPGPAADPAEQHGARDLGPRGSEPGAARGGQAQGRGTQDWERLSEGEDPTTG